MNKSYTFLKSCISSLAFFLFSFTAFSNPYFAFEESFALGTIHENNHYPIITFIPRSMLLYIDERSTLKPISDRLYVKAKTQDGVNVFVDSSTVSNRSFSEAIGSHQVIFNSAYQICRDIGCNSNFDEEIWNVHAGDAFELYSVDNLPRIGELRATRNGETFSGYIQLQELNGLTDRGIVTRADQQHPRYSISKLESTVLSTECGDTVTENTTRSIGANISVTLGILSAFGIGVRAETDDSVIISRSYGSNNTKISFFEYTIVDESETPSESKYVSQVIYECESDGIIRPLTRINRVDIMEAESGWSESLSFDDFNTKDGLTEYTGGPYLFSVNSYDQYTETMDRLGRIFRDRTLAGYFLSEFNRSCGSQYRNLGNCK